MLKDKLLMSSEVETEPPPEEGFVKAKLTIETAGPVVRDPFGAGYVGFDSSWMHYSKLSPQLYDRLNVAVNGLYIRADGPFYYNGIKYQGNETGDGSVGTPPRILWDEWVSLRGQTVDVWLKKILEFKIIKGTYTI